MRFEFATANRILFGSGVLSEVPALAASLGERVFLATDSMERSARLRDDLQDKGLYVESALVAGEPDIACILMATRIIKETKCNLVISFGGGSAIDTGKAAAALLTNSRDPLDYLEVIGLGLPLEKASAPFIAIPTTAGTGSEVTRNAVITVPEKRVKVSLRGPSMLPSIACVDPELTYSLPPSVTAATGLDALTQAIEPFVCISPNPLTDAICKEAITRAAKSLQRAWMNGLDISAREDMSLVSLFGGLALANAKLGGVHGMANTIGGFSHAPHGVVCARLLPLVMKMNLQALRTRLPSSPAIERYTEVARLLTGDKNASAEAGADWIQKLVDEFKIMALKENGLNSDDFPDIVAHSQKANSMKGNPISLTDEELLSILAEA